MKAIVKLKPEPGLLFTDVAMPKLQESDVLIKIKTTSICGTDLHIYEWNAWAKNTLKIPLIIGHEFVGEIVECGKAVTHLNIGDRVTGEGHITCGYCKLCKGPNRHLCPRIKGLGIQRDGCFAEYLAFPASNIIKIPPFISDDIASMLDPLGNAVHSVLTQNSVAEDVLITGAGPIGLMCVALCSHLGAKNIVITDINDYRLALAKKIGATKAINIQNESLDTIKNELNLEDGFTFGLEMSGHKKAIDTQLNLLAPGSTLAALGITSNDINLDWNKLIFKGLTIKGIYGREMFNTWEKMFNLLESGLNLSALITHHFKPKEYEQAFKVALSGEAGKVFLHWS